LRNKHSSLTAKIGKRRRSKAWLNWRLEKILKSKIRE